MMSQSPPVVAARPLGSQLDPEIAFACSNVGSCKTPGQIDADRAAMRLNVEPQLRVTTGGITPRICLQISAEPRPEDRPNIDTHESSIELTLSEARRLSDWIQAEVRRLSGL